MTDKQKKNSDETAEDCPLPGLWRDPSPGGRSLRNRICENEKEQ